MSSLILVFITGLSISFLGTLPLGSLNVSAMQVAITENTRNATRFSLGVALVEILYVRFSLQGIDWIIAHRQLFYLMEWITVVLFSVLSVSSFLAASKKNMTTHKNILLSNTMNRFWLGFTMSAVNPVQVPFWFIWSTYLLSNRILLPNSTYFNIYTTGIGIGTLTGLAVFVFTGKWLLQRLNASHHAINLIAGAVFLVSALVQLYRVIHHPFLEQLRVKTGH